MALGGCGFQSYDPQNLRFLYGAKTIYLESFSNDTFRPELDEITRLSLIGKIDAVDALSLAKTPDAELLLSVTVRSAGLGTKVINSELNRRQFTYSVSAEMRAVSTLVFGTKPPPYVFNVSASVATQRSLSRLSDSDARTLAVQAAEELGRKIFDVLVQKF